MFVPWSAVIYANCLALSALYNPWTLQLILKFNHINQKPPVNGIYFWVVSYNRILRINIVLQTKVNKHSRPSKTSKACLIYGSLGQPFAVSKWKGFCLVPNLNPNGVCKSNGVFIFVSSRTLLRVLWGVGLNTKWKLYKKGTLKHTQIPSLRWVKNNSFLISLPRFGKLWENGHDTCETSRKIYVCPVWP